MWNEKLQKWIDQSLKGWVGTDHTRTYTERVCQKFVLRAARSFEVEAIFGENYLLFKLSVPTFLRTYL